MEIEGNVLVKVFEDDIEENGKLIIPEGITTIGKNAIFGLGRLKEVIIPSSVVNIEESGFAYCFNLPKLELPNSIKIIADGAFRECRHLTEINIPNGIQSIGKKAFSNCINLEKIHLPDGITRIEEGTFSNCRSLKEIQLPNSVEIVEKLAFARCSKLEKVNLPINTTEIKEATFEGCYSLLNIDMPESVIKIEDKAFKECKNLKEIKIPNGVISIGSEAFLNCEAFTEINLPESIEKIGDACFCGCYGLKSINIPNKVYEIPTEAFCRCSNLEEIKLPENLKVIDRRAFSNCKKLSKINIPNSVTKIGDAAFRKCASIKKFNIPNSIETIGIHAFLFENGDMYEKNEVINEIEIPMSIQFVGREFFLYNSTYYDKEKGILKLYNKSNPSKYIPSKYLEYLCKMQKLKTFLTEANFKNFESHVGNQLLKLESESSDEQLCFFKFANNLGCFSNQKIIDEKGRETGTTYSQKASALLAMLLQTNGMEIGSYNNLFKMLPYEAEPNIELIKFLTPQGKNNSNLELLLKMEKQFPGIFAKVVENFNEVKKCRKSISENGTPRIIPWSEAIKKCYIHTQYEGVDEENKDIAEVFWEKGVKQEAFEQEVSLRKKAKQESVPEHLLGKELKEESYLEKIQQLRQKSQKELSDSKKILDELYKRCYTYEWLNKRNPINAIIGLYVDCCATIVSSFYGEKLSKQSIISKELQNLVIRDINGQIVSKGIVYVNEEFGYAVINDFELNEKYKENEFNDPDRGFYVGDDKSEDKLSNSERNQRENRNLIFEAYKRGINAFVEEYDKQHPNKPIQQVNVGMGHNKLKRNVQQLEKSIETLKVPEEYRFEDAKYVQHIMYKRNVIDKEKEDR